MKGIRFYLEYPENVNPRRYTRKNPGPHSGTVMAVIVENGYWYGNMGCQWECISALQDQPNSVCCSGNCSDGYIRERTKRISEKQAREIHPNLFAYLD